MAFCKYHSDPECEDCRRLNPEEQKKLEVTEEMKKGEFKSKESIYPSSKSFISFILILILVILGAGSIGTGLISDCFLAIKKHLSANPNKLISPYDFSYVNSNITEENFPDIGCANLEDAKVYDFGKYVSSEYAISEMEKDGYRPANLRELLIWMPTNWNGKDWVVALGQSWRGPSGNRYVPCLRDWVGERSLFLCYLEYGWSASYRFLAFRKSSPR